MPRPVAYVAEIRISASVESKINTKHNVTIADVQEAAMLTKVIRSKWHEHPDRGWRLLLTGTVGDSSRSLNVVLYPVDEGEGIWNLGTAMWAM